MRNASAAVLTGAPAHIVPWRNPEGDFTASYVNTPAGRTTGRIADIGRIGDITEGPLSQMQHGTAVLISGIIEVVRVFEPRSEHVGPNAVLRLSSGTGADVSVMIRPQHYERVWGYLVMGRRFGVAGKVIRREPSHPVLLDFMRLLMAQTDTVTAQQYAAYAQQAVSL